MTSEQHQYPPPALLAQAPNTPALAEPPLSAESEWTEEVNGSIVAPIVYYDLGRRSYWTQDIRGTSISMTEGSIKRYLKAAGFSATAVIEGELSPLDREILRLQLASNINFAGPLAGHVQGLSEICGRRILVTDSPKLITPAPGEFPILAKILDGMLNGPTKDQRPFLYGWLKLSVEALRSGARRPGQVLVFAGPPDMFKSGLQNLITVILGGRVAKPYRYMAGITAFNWDLFGAEHLMIEDEVASTSVKSRRHFGARIKDLIVNEVQSCHGKGRDAVSLRPFWRLTISVNDEPENLLILPPIDESLADKLMLLKVKEFDMPMPTATVKEREAFWKTLLSELPAFMAFLESWQIPSELISDRFGITHYHDPDLVVAIDSLSPEIQLLNLIDAVLFGDPMIRRERRVSAAELEKILTNSVMRSKARKVLDWSGATGTYLGRLATKRPNRVEKDRKSNSRGWIIYPPKPGMTP